MHLRRGMLNCGALEVVHVCFLVADRGKDYVTYGGLGYTCRM